MLPLDEIDYEMESEDELQEIMGEDANSENVSLDSDELRKDAYGNDLELVNEGWIVYDDYISDSDNDTII